MSTKRERCYIVFALIENVQKFLMFDKKVCNYRARRLESNRLIKTRSSVLFSLENRACEIPMLNNFFFGPCPSIFICKELIKIWLSYRREKCLSNVWGEVKYSNFFLFHDMFCLDARAVKWIRGCVVDFIFVVACSVFE